MSNLIQIDFINKRLGRMEMESPKGNKTFDELKTRVLSLKPYSDSFDLNGIKQRLDRVNGNSFYKTPITKETSKTIYVDTYGNGCSHNSLGNPYRETLIAANSWNKPFPLLSCPTDLIRIALRAQELGKTINIGHKSDPCQWLDRKFKITHGFIVLLERLGVNYVINTSSDLVAHYDYREVIKTGKVNLRIPKKLIKNKLTKGQLKEISIRGISSFKLNELMLTDSIIRRLEPGAPSLARRKAALVILRREGVSVRVTSSFIMRRV